MFKILCFIKVPVKKTQHHDIDTTFVTFSSSSSTQKSMSTIFSVV